MNDVKNMYSERKHKDYMRMAIDLASSQLDKTEGRPFGAVVVKEEQILGASFNRAVLDNDPTAHAEIMAIREACKTVASHRLDGATIYSSCEPCPMCLGAIYWSGIQTLYFGCSSEEAEQFGFGDYLLRTELCMEKAGRKLRSSQLLNDEALISFEIWQAHGGKLNSLTDWR